ncbi:MAG: CpsD/CapB family tyrosine-protein kinase [Oscillospiraceae bacterium]|nr:CpsD/CapB family tyrosine-protein kinase [Oscillospiraceae bacterium]
MFRKSKIDSVQYSVAEKRQMMCSNLSFAASEAYKLLRTNVIFSLPGEQKCRVIGVTSSMRGEGKSTTSINLSYSLAQTGKRVLTIEADMRLPTIYKVLRLSASPGLSNLLVGLSSGTDVTKDSGYLDNWKVITAGDIPPNPSELLGSENMRITVETYAKHFDFIVIDLPPVNAVSDALVVSKLTDGMIMVVRQDYSDKKSVTEAVSQFQFSDAKLLGFVLTCAGGSGKSYKRYGKYSKYYKSYGYGYESKPTLQKKEAGKTKTKTGASGIAALEKAPAAPAETAGKAQGEEQRG